MIISSALDLAWVLSAPMILHLEDFLYHLPSLKNLAKPGQNLRSIAYCLFYALVLSYKFPLPLASRMRAAVYILQIRPKRPRPCVQIINRSQRFKLYTGRARAHELKTASTTSTLCPEHLATRGHLSSNTAP